MTKQTQKSILADISSQIVPKEVMTIPSTGESVEYRPYLVKEEKVLLLAQESGDQGKILRASADLIEQCTFGSLSRKKLTLLDFEYILLKLRVNSVGETAMISVPCANCSTDVVVQVDFTKAELPVLSDDPETGKFEISNQVIIKMHHPQITHLLKFYDQIDSGELSDPGEIAIRTVALHIKEIHFKDQIFHADQNDPMETVDFVENLYNLHFTKLLQYVNTIPKVEIPVDYTCQSCNHEHSIKYFGYYNFFR